MRAACSGAATSAPIAARFALAGLSSVSSGLPDAARRRANASVLPPGAAWAMKMRWARLATNSLHCAASAAVARRTVAGNGDSTADGRPPTPGASRAGCASPRCRARDRRRWAARPAAAGAGTRAPSASGSRRLKGAPASRSARARSYVFRMRSPPGTGWSRRAPSAPPRAGADCPGGRWSRRGGGSASR